jgi:uncharacterized membrane protein YeaQ/YmgE (transglycosylase-associated protein family)
MGTWKRNSIVSVKFCPRVTCLQQSSQFANGSGGMVGAILTSTIGAVVLLLIVNLIQRLAS